MLYFVEDLQKEAYDSGYDTGYDSGYDFGIDKVNALIRVLSEKKRYADLERSANDPQYQAQLIKDLLPENSNPKNQ